MSPADGDNLAGPQLGGSRLVIRKARDIFVMPGA